MLCKQSRPKDTARGTLLPFSRHRAQSIDLWYSACFAALAVGVLSIAAAGGEPGNLVRNPSLEDDTQGTPWSGGFVVDSNVACAGARSARLDFSAGKTPSVVLGDVSVIQPGRSYRLRAMTRADLSGPGLRLRVHLKDAEGHFTLTRVADTGPKHGWEPVELKFSAGSQDRRIWLCIEGRGQLSGTAWVDDVVLEERTIGKGFLKENRLALLTDQPAGPVAVSLDAMNPDRLRVCRLDADAESLAELDRFGAIVVCTSGTAAAGDRVRGLRPRLEAWAAAGKTIFLDLADWASLHGVQCQTRSIPDEQHEPKLTREQLLQLTDAIGKLYGKKVVEPADFAEPWMRAAFAGYAAELKEPVLSIRITAEDKATQGFRPGCVVPWCGSTRGEWRHRFVPREGLPAGVQVLAETAHDAGASRRPDFQSGPASPSRRPDFQSGSASPPRSPDFQSGSANLSRRPDFQSGPTSPSFVKQSIGNGAIYAADLSSLAEPHWNWATRTSTYKYVWLGNLVNDSIRFGRHWSRRPTYGEFVEEMRRLGQADPRLGFRLLGYEKTSSDRCYRIYGFAFGDLVKPAYVYTAALHAEDEWTTSLAAFSLAEWFSRNMDRPQVQRRLADHSVVIVPIAWPTANFGSLGTPPGPDRIPAASELPSQRPPVFFAYQMHLAGGPLSIVLTTIPGVNDAWSERIGRDAAVQYRDRSIYWTESDGPQQPLSGRVVYPMPPSWYGYFRHPAMYQTMFTCDEVQKARNFALSEATRNGYWPDSLAGHHILRSVFWDWFPHDLAFTTDIQVQLAVAAFLTDPPSLMPAVEFPKP